MDRKKKKQIGNWDHKLPEKFNQLDCARGNEEMQSLFAQWVCDSFKYLPNALQHFRYELEAIIGFADFMFSIYIDKPQPLDCYYQIVFKKINKKIKILWLIFSVILPYLSKKLQAYSAGKQSAFWNTINRYLLTAKRVINFLEFINYAIFLCEGKFRSIVQRVLGIKMELLDQQNKRVLQFELLNRELMWKIYQNFLKTVAPFLFKFARGHIYNLFALDSYLQTEEDQSCAYCSSLTPTIPYKMEPCEHKACYYCYQKNKTEDGYAYCALCGCEIQCWVPLVQQREDLENDDN